MTETAHPMRPQTPLYDQILRQLELGQTSSAILSLAGICDGVIAAGGNESDWRESLQSHPLFAVLQTLEANGDPTIRALGANQAAASRQTLTDRALSNAGVSSSAQQLFAVEMPDLRDAGALADELSALKGQLVRSGRIFISSFVPGHLGLGWQRIVCGSETHCHDEQSLEAAASVAGLSIQHFRDASDCLVWAVLQSAAPEQRPTIHNKEEGNFDGRSCSNTRTSGG